MSHRITLLALSVAAALIAKPAIADPECFEDSCRVPAVPEATTTQAATPKPEVSAESEAVTTATREAEPAPHADSRPAPALPKVVASPRAQLPPRPSTPTDEIGVPREPARAEPVADRDRTPANAKPVAQIGRKIPAYVPPERPPHPGPQLVPGRIVSDGPAPGGAVVVEVPGAVHTADGIVTVYPNLRPDPAWKLCQIDSRDLGRRSYRCTAYSYQPYGEHGYRPFGTYCHYQSAPGYVIAPSAKIISIETAD
jgi:hypothetical protein